MTAAAPTRLIDRPWFNKLCILLVAALWGYSFVTMKGMVAQMPVFYLLMLRNAVAAVAMVLLESVIAFHRSEVVLLAVWFALLGAMVLEPGNRKLRVLALAIWGAAALALLLLHLLRFKTFQRGGIFVLIGLTLAGWTWRETGR